MRIPIACTLSAGDAVDRGTEWRQLVADHVEEIRRAPGTASLHLRAGDAALAAAADLAARELACCAFFTFSIAIEPDGRWLRVGAPEDAEPVLAALFD